MEKNSPNKTKLQKQRKTVDWSLVPIDKLLANLKIAHETNDARQRVVLWQTGSYNPAHRMHIEMFEIARAFVESEEFPAPSVVVGGFMSPSHDNYVSHKMQSATGGPQRHFSQDQRLEILRRASADNTRLEITALECHDAGSRSFNYVIADNLKVIQQKLLLDTYEFPTDFVSYYVCGSDHAARASLWLPEKRSNVNGMIVLARENIIQKVRKGASLDDVSAVKQGIATAGAQNVWLLPNTIKEISSTLVRKLMRERDWEELKEIMHPSVIEYLKSLD